MEELQEIFRDVFDDENLEINENTTAEDIEDWDSLMHIQLMVAISKKFGVKFATQEIAHLENVGGIAKLINDKKSKEE